MCCKSLFVPCRFGGRIGIVPLLLLLLFPFFAWGADYQLIREATKAIDNQDYELAEVRLREAENGSEDPSILLWAAARRAMMHNKCGEPEKALQALAGCSGLFEDAGPVPRGDALREKLIALEKLKRFNEAETVGADGLKSLPTHPMFILAYGSLTARLKKTAEAERIYRRLESVETQKEYWLAVMNFGIGEACYLAGKTEKAVEYLKKAAGMNRKLRGARKAATLLEKIQGSQKMLNYQFSNLLGAFCRICSSHNLLCSSQIRLKSLVNLSKIYGSSAISNSPRCEKIEIYDVGEKCLSMTRGSVVERLTIFTPAAAVFSETKYSSKVNSP